MTEAPVMEEVQEEEHGKLYEMTRRLLLGSIGAVALAQDEAEKWINKLVERGEIAEKDGRKLMDELNERSKEALEKSRERVQDILPVSNGKKTVEEVLEELDIPSKSDIDALSRKINALTKKIDDLKKE